MGLLTFFNSIKNKIKGWKKNETAEAISMEVDPSEINPPETRFTEEYKDFLEEQEAAGNRDVPSDEECGQ